MLEEIAPIIPIQKIGRQQLRRREFIKRACCTASGLGLAGSLGRFGVIDALAQAVGDYKALVCVFLFGGNDSNNMLVPLGPGYAPYAAARGILTLPQASLLTVTPPSLGQPFGFHPSLPRLQQLFVQKQLAALVNVGVTTAPTTRAEALANSTILPENLFSHLDQQDQWQTCFGTTNGSTSGWGGRIADVFQPVGGPPSLPTLISVAGDALFCHGASTNPLEIAPGGPYGFTALSGSSEAQARGAAMQQLLTFSSGATLIQAANQSLLGSFQAAAALGQAVANVQSLETTFPNSPLGQALLQIAQLIQVRSTIGASRQIFFASMGGFDTHTDQMPIHAALLSQLDAALSAFYSATVELGVTQQVTTFTMSDFSRTLQPNSDGSDHAWGGHHLILGGAVKGGDIYGTFPDLSLGGPDDATQQGRWVPTTSVDQYAATLAAWFGVPASSLSSIAPGLANFSMQNLGFV